MANTKYPIHFLLFLIMIYVAESELNFLQLTDNHYDWDYKIGADQSRQCREGEGLAGQYGYGDRESHCQAPLITLDSAVQAAALYDADAVMITGDLMRSGNYGKTTRETWVKKMQEMTDVFAKAWPSGGKATVLPVLGNHDQDPQKKVLTPGPEWLYEILSSMWSDYLPDQAAIDSFKQGGFYQVQDDHHNIPGLRFVVLNTCIYTLDNNYTVNSTDPAGQFEWFNGVLNDSRANGDKIWLLFHCPPSAVEFQLPFLNRFVKLLSDFSDVIKGTVAGHIHHSMFQLVQDDNGHGDNTIGSIFICPSISPDNGKGGAHAPSFRNYVVSDSFDPLDYDQVTLNLTNANKGVVRWDVEYSAAGAYGLPDLTPPSMRKLYEMLDSSNTTVFHEFWDRFWSGWQPASDHYSCDDLVCRHGILWAMRYLVPPEPDY